MLSRQIVGWGLVLVFVGLPQALLADMEETPVASIELEREVHFVTPDEDNVIVPAGFYTVEAADHGLQLVHGLLPDEGGDMFLLQAKKGTHEEQLDGPIARSIAVEEDAHYLTLLLPEGQSLEAIGSYSGVRPRGANWWERVRQKAKNSLVAVGDRYEEVTEWNRLCKTRFTKANDINTCCTSKYNSCKRVCRKKGKQRASCQQQCETLNEGCWIRRDPNPNWMVNYCGNTKNQQRKGMSVCCERMEKRCKQACQSFPKSGRAEFCGRCLTAGKICQSDQPPTKTVRRQDRGILGDSPTSQELGSICYRDGTPPQKITPETALWMAKMIDGETWGRPSQEDADAMLWTMAQRTVVPSWRGKPLHKKIQEYSQPINSRWTKTGDKCSKYYADGYRGSPANNCSEKRVNKRASNRLKKWNDTTVLSRQAVRDFSAGSIANPVVGAIGWFAPQTWERRQKSGKNAEANMVFHAQISGNVYFTRGRGPNTTMWDGDEVTVVGPGSICPVN